MEFTRNGLTLCRGADGTYTCAELRALPQAFEARWSGTEVQGFIDEIIAVARSRCLNQPASVEERDGMTHDDRHTAGVLAFDQVVREIEPEGLTLFQRALFWAGHEWWFNDPRMLARVFFPHKEEIGRAQRGFARFVLPVLPQPVQDGVRGMEMAGIACNARHFALLFIGDDRDNTRRIVTDTQLLELWGVYGYVYLDITDDGKPVARSACDEMGGRAFFDGERLMCHQRFMTCAPTTVIIDGGYKVNSTRCTIVNGRLLDLIDDDDFVAHTTGAVCGQVAFDQRDALRSVVSARMSGSRMKVEDGKIMLDGNELKPVGIFQRSQTILLNSGFVGFDWSAFVPCE